MYVCMYQLPTLVKTTGIHNGYELDATVQDVIVD